MVAKKGTLSLFSFKSLTLVQINKKNRGRKSLDTCSFNKNKMKKLSTTAEAGPLRIVSKKEGQKVNALKNKNKSVYNA